MEGNLDHFGSFIRKIVPGASNDEIKAFSSQAKSLEFQKGEFFVKEGQVCRTLLFIHRGLFRYYLLHEGKDITKDFAVDSQNPFCTSFTSFMLQKPSEIWIEALETSQVWAWDKSDVEPLFEHHP
ncbi:MAG: cyclic nucleotide-binding domain-containing protein, partial [Verrucomicrobia bacterium]|nr:cyclic nucleotide-binding domain-containing protein [Verrucomicrobiota bacterium]